VVAVQDGTCRFAPEADFINAANTLLTYVATRLGNLTQGVWALLLFLLKKEIARTITNNLPLQITYECWYT
jgi:hypothetical protein